MSSVKRFFSSSCRQELLDVSQSVVGDNVYQFFQILNHAWLWEVDLFILNYYTFLLVLNLLGVNLTDLLILGPSTSSTLLFPAFFLVDCFNLRELI